MQKVYFHSKLSNLKELNDSITKELGKYFTLIEFDKQLRDEYLPWAYKEEEPRILFIPAILDSSNTLSYDGIEFALQWYFKLIQNNEEFALCIVGFEEKAAFFEHCDYSNFIKCPNVYYTEFGIDNILVLSKEIKPQLFSSEEYSDSLKKIGIKPPSSYKSHHGITNEWAISRWSKYLGFSTPLNEEIESSLYFQYLKTIHRIEPIKTQQNFLIAEGKLLLIDDEEGKGWNTFFQKLKLPGSKLVIKSIGNDFKNIKTKEDIVDIAEKTIKDFEPDTVIIDLRLHDSDFDENNPKELTGFKILEKIKSEINNGIQAIIFSASNKIWNYRALNAVGIDGWIMKESPELSTDSSFSANTIKELKEQVSNCLKRSYLKEIYSQKNEMIGKLKELPPDEYINEIINHLRLSYSLLTIADSKEQYAFAFVSLYLVIEKINNQFVAKDKEGNWIIDSSVKLCAWSLIDNEYVPFTEKEKDGKKYRLKHVMHNKPPEWQKFAGIYYQKWNIKDHDFIRQLYFLINKRNGFIHNDKSILNKTDKEGNYLNQDIFSAQGYVKLFKHVKIIISYLY